jgi:hypothetical protein
MAVLPIGINPATGGGGAGGYQIERSLRFNSADSAYLSRTPASTGSQTSWTWSGWVKRSAITNTQDNIYAINNSNRICFSNGDSSQTLFFEVYNGGGADYYIGTSAVYRDVSAWYHIVAVWDSNNATAGDRQRLYVNGIRITAFSSGNSIPSGATSNNWNGTAAHNIGRSPVTANHFNGYLTEIYFIDGQALTPSSFGETDSATGVWKPKAYSGTYGTNGFYLKFADNSGTTSTTLGKDSSGNGNNWTPNNFSVTAGAGNDSMVDSPTAYGTDTGVGGEVRGNYCTLNPLDSATSASNPTNGNLDWSSAAANANYYPSRGTMGVSSGKWYWEVTCGTSGGGFQIGIAGQAVNFANNPSQQLYNCVDGYCYFASALKGNNGSTASYGATYTTNDVIGVALDMDAGTLVFYKNGVSQGTAYSSLSGTFFAAISDNSGSNNSSATFNFGQRAFAYTAPSGFKALCTTNLPTPTIGATSTTQANKYFAINTYAGTGATNAQTVGFAPDFVWIKARTNAYWHKLFDTIRGANKPLVSNDTGAELTETQGLMSFDSNGFTLGTSSDSTVNNAGSGQTYVAWCWDAAGSNATNTSGTITSTVRANTTSGFSIVTYTGTNASGATIGHGLGAVPAMIIIKNRSSAEAWPVYHAYNTSAPETDYLVLNTTAATADATTPWNDTLPTSTVFTLGNWNALNENGSNHVAYCFAPVAGYSAFGSYTGNGSTDGPFVYTNFRPRWVMFKKSSGTSNWGIVDTARDTFNVTDLYLYANLSNAEATGTSTSGPFLDVLSNGFKLRGNSGDINDTSATYIYAAFAESPFKYSLAR